MVPQKHFSHFVRELGRKGFITYFICLWINLDFCSEIFHIKSITMFAQAPIFGEWIFFSETWRWFFLIANKSIRNWKRTSLFFERSSYWESEKYNLHNLILKFSLFLTSMFNPSFISINSLSSRVNVFRHTRRWSATLLKKETPTQVFSREF